MTSSPVAPTAQHSREKERPRACPSAEGQTPGLRSVWDLIREQTGIELHKDTWLDSRVKRSRLVAQTEEMEWKLQQAGVETRRTVEAPIMVAGLGSGTVEELTPWRNINFLPAVAAANRSGQLRSFNYFARDKAFLRYMVFTGGTRCPIDELRLRVRDLSRRVSRLAADPALKAWGIEVVCRVTEWTVKREADGSASCHPHANVVVNCKRFLGDDWHKFLALARLYMGGARVRDCGRVVDAAEVIKYPCKPAELDELTGEELAAMAAQVYKLKVFQPMGAFLKLRADLERERVKPAKRHAGGNWKWCLVKRGPARAKSEKSAAGEIPRNLLMTITTPQPRFGPKLEPCAVIYNFAGSVGAVMDANGLGDLLQMVRTRYAAAAAQPRPLSSTPTRQLSGVRTYRLDPGKEHKAKWSRWFGSVRIPDLFERNFPEAAKRKAARQER